MTELNFAIYERGKLTEILQPDHVDLIGLHMSNNKYIYKKNTPLEVGLIWPNKVCLDEYRVPVTVALSDSSGLTLRIKEFDPVMVRRWTSILHKVNSI